MDVKRRTFMKALGLTAAGALLPGCDKDIRRLVPYVLPDDEIVPGVAEWYASTCGECHAGCGIIVKVMEGRAKKIEGNPLHPVNQGKLCAHGQAALQGLYNPDRLRGPLRRMATETGGHFVPVPWTDGLQELADRVRQAKGPVIMISRPLSGTLADVVTEFIKTVKGSLYFYDPSAELPLRAALQQTFGTPDLPCYDIAEADYVLSFGAPFLEQWLSPVSFGMAFGRMREGRNSRRGRFIHIEPRLSLTAASADRWLPIRPGTEGLLALGIGHVLLLEHRSSLPIGRLPVYESLYGRLSLDEVARDTEIPAAEIRQMAKTFAEADRPLALGGGTACAHTNAFESHMAIHGLNTLAGNINRAGGMRWYEPAGLASHPDIPWLSERRIRQVTQTVEESGQRPLLLLYDCNPLFDVPPGVPIRQLFERASYIASFSGSIDESTAAADVVLPDHHRLETWGDHAMGASSPHRAVSLVQPVVVPLYETRGLGDTILELTGLVHGRQAVADAFPEYLRKRWQKFHASPSSRSHEPFQGVWEELLQQGGSWDPAVTEQRRHQSVAPVDYQPAQFDGEAAEFPLYLYPYPSPTLGHGRGANLPWLQELPDTMTSAVWGSWIEINPATAHAMRIQQGQLVRIHSRHGSLDAPAVLYPGLRPDVVAMPIGQGHTNYGRYAARRGPTPLTILAPLFDKESGALAIGATRVRAEPLSGRGNLVLLEKPGTTPAGGSELLSIERPPPATSAQDSTVHHQVDRRPVSTKGQIHE
ncbi:MAG: 4Fe-4S Mo/W bis-MGD-type domain-containing protein [Nitrospira sp.]|nr:MAG: 4Fe-4S Mo/W bis-MGD-type domain-containing protein [Nitrospira sp.]